MTDRRDPRPPAAGTVSVGTLRLRVTGMSPAAATVLAREVANRLAEGSATDGWRSTPAVSVSVPAAGAEPLGARTAGAIGAALGPGRKGG